MSYRTEDKRRFSKGRPESFGLYDCNLSDGRSVVVDCDPWGDDETDGELLEAEIIEFRRIPGERYKSAL